MGQSSTCLVEPHRGRWIFDVITFVLIVVAVSFLLLLFYFLVSSSQSLSLELLIFFDLGGRGRPAPGALPLEFPRVVCAKNIRIYTKCVSYVFELVRTKLFPSFNKVRENKSSTSIFSGRPLVPPAQTRLRT